MTQRGWWAVDLLCGLLDRDERAAVCGDLVEAHASTGRALIEVGGLVVRRQAALWVGWRPWLALFTIVIPLGFLLSVSSRWFGDGIAVPLWVYARFGKWSYLAVPGWRRDVIALSTTAMVSFAALVAWSWTIGFALARLSRRAWFTLALALALMIVLGTAGSTTTARFSGYRHVDPRFSGYFFEPIVRVFLVMLPAWWGLCRGSKRTPLGSIRAIAIAVTVIALTTQASDALERSLIFGWGLVYPPRGVNGLVDTSDLWWVSFVLLWPAAYLLMHSIRDTALRRSR